MEAVSPLVRGVSRRRFDLDWLRVLAFLLLVVSHAANLFVGWGEWPIRSGHVSWGLERAVLFLSLWRLPLVFFVAGAGAAFSLKKRGPSGFAWERLQRLLVPLAAGIFTIIPLQVWLEARHAGRTGESFLDFLPRAWASGPSPQGFLGWHHLWFLGYLLLFTLLLAATHTLLSQKTAWVRTLERILGWRGAFLLLGLIPGVLTASLGPNHPPTFVLFDDWWNLSQSFCFFFAGYALAQIPRGFEHLTALRGRALGLGLVSVGLLFTQDWLNIRTFAWWNAGWHFWMKGVAAWAWVLALVGFAGAHLNRPSSWIRKANEAVFPLFLWHLAVLWGVGILLAHLQWSFLVELTLALVLTLGGTAALVKWAIQPFDGPRFLYGLRPRKPLFELEEEPANDPSSGIFRG